MSGDLGLALFNAIDLSITLLCLGPGIILLKQKQWAETTCTAVIALPALFAIAEFDPSLPLASIFRFALLAFPVFILLGERLSS